MYHTYNFPFRGSEEEEFLLLYSGSSEEIFLLRNIINDISAEINDFKSTWSVIDSFKSSSLCVNYLSLCLSRNNERAEDFFKRRFYGLKEICKKDFAPALFSLAEHYDDGDIDFLEKNKNKAEELFIKAANMGHPWSCQYYGSILLFGSGRTVACNRRKEGIFNLIYSSRSGLRSSTEILFTHVFNEHNYSFPEALLEYLYFRVSNNEWKFLYEYIGFLRKGDPIKKRKTIEGVLYKKISHSRWKDVPDTVFPYENLPQIYFRWYRSGVWKDIMKALFILKNLVDVIH